MESPLLQVPGAVAADGPDTGVAAHYGDPFAEQRALAASAGLVDRSNRGVLRITGKDRLTWLNDLSTQKVDDLAPGTATDTLILSPHGHVEHALSLVDDGTTTWLHTEPEQAPAVLAFLESMRFMLRVEAADVTGDYALLTAAGPDVPAGVGQEATAMLRYPFGIDLLVPRASLADVAQVLRERGLSLAGMWAHEALRIAGHRARFGVDTDHRTIPHEVGWISSAVHLTKGCYRGQETVARVHNLGHPPRRLVMLHLDGSEDRLPARGAPVSVAEVADAGAGADGVQAIGFTGSSARHFELGPIALALIKRTVPVDATLRTEGISAAQEVIVPPDAGANVTISLGRRRNLAPGSRSS